MSDETTVIDAAALRLLRAAVDTAAAAGADFVTPVHLLAAFAGAREPFRALVDPGRLEAAAAVPSDAAVRRLPEPALGAAPPFERFESLAIRSSDGRRTAWLDADALVAVREALRAADGVLDVRALGAGLAAAARRDRVFAAQIAGGADALADAVREL